jgi:hypothetical protein
MNVLSILKQNNIDIKYQIAHQAGAGGADGEVFLLNENKVIKFSIIYDVFDSMLNSNFNYRLSVLDWVMKNNPQGFAFVFDYGLLFESCRFKYNLKQDYIIYFSILEKCEPLSSDEEKIIYSLVNSQLDENKIEMLSRFLVFSKKEIFDLIQNMKASKIKQTDLRVENIMKNSKGFCIIDYDKCVFKQGDKK